MKPHIAILLLAALSPAAGCRPLHPDQDMEGLYQLTTPYGTSTLVLSSNHEMRQELHLPNAQPVVIEGKWSQTGDTVVLTPFATFNPVTGTPEVSLDGHLPVDPDFPNATEMIANEDQGWTFARR